MKYLLSLILVLLCIADADAARRRSSYSPLYAAIVIDESTGRILHTDKAYKKVHPASLTKMMTLYILFEAIEKKRIRINHRLKFSRKATHQKPSKLGLKVGSTISVKNAIMALLTKSANDVAVVVAETLGKSEANFAKMMTKKARQLGMKQTTFRNASGLHHPQQITTAHDMAILAKALFRNFPTYYRYFKTKTFWFRGQRYNNHNKLLGRVNGVDGLKTGYIRAAGYNLAASAKRNNTRLIAVVMGGKTGKWRDQRVTNLINTSFKNYKPPVRTPNIKPTHRSLSSVPGLRLASAELDLHKSVKPLRVKRLQTTPTPKPRKALITNSNSKSRSGDWAIQIGSHQDPKTAQVVATDTKARFKVLQNAELTIEASPGKVGRKFRTRLVGLHKEDANVACHLIRMAGEACIVLQPRLPDILVTAER